MRKLEFDGLYIVSEVEDFLISHDYTDFKLYVIREGIEIWLPGEDAMRFVLEDIDIPESPPIFRGFDVEQHLKNTLAKEITKEIDLEIAKAIVNESTN